MAKPSGSPSLSLGPKNAMVVEGGAVATTVKGTLVQDQVGEVLAVASVEELDAGREVAMEVVVEV